MNETEKQDRAEQEHLKTKLRHCKICGAKLGVSFFGPPGFSRNTGILYKNATTMRKAENLQSLQGLAESASCWVAICKDCHAKKVQLPEEFKNIPKKEHENKKIQKQNTLKRKLIECPDCLKPVSLRAVACPNCGCPIKDLEIPEPEAAFNTSQLPNLPDDLSIGGAKADWRGLNLKVSYNFNENVINCIDTGKKRLVLFEHGISIASHIFDINNGYPIHFAQIIDADYVDRSNLGNYIEKEKSVLKRAVVGTLVAGPLWGIVGAISGIGTKKISESDCLIIKFWEVSDTTITPQYILFQGSKMKQQMEKFALEVNNNSIKYKKQIP